MSKIKWYVVCEGGEQDRDVYTISTDPECVGWNTDSGYPGYGLPKELAEWVVRILNESEKQSPYMNDEDYWKKVEE